ncbi:uncharacterized protein V6R79_016527 [Siganus canaliculatus]
MLLRHNWVRLVRRGHISAIQRGILESSDTGLILLKWAYVYLEVNKKKIRRRCFDKGKINKVVYAGCRLLGSRTLATAVIRELWTVAMRARASCCTPTLPYKVMRNSLHQPCCAVSG